MFITHIHEDLFCMERWSAGGSKYGNEYSVI